MTDNMCMNVGTAPVLNSFQSSPSKSSPKSNNVQNARSEEAEPPDTSTLKLHSLGRAVDGQLNDFECPVSYDVYIRVRAVQYNHYTTVLGLKNKETTLFHAMVSTCCRTLIPFHDA